MYTFNNYIEQLYLNSLIRKKYYDLYISNKLVIDQLLNIYTIDILDPLFKFYIDCIKKIIDLGNDKNIHIEYFIHLGTDFINYIIMKTALQLYDIRLVTLCYKDLIYSNCVFDLCSIIKSCMFEDVETYTIVYINMSECLYDRASNYHEYSFIKHFNTYIRILKYISTKNVKMIFINNLEKKVGSDISKLVNKNNEIIEIYLRKTL